MTTLSDAPARGNPAPAELGLEQMPGTVPERNTKAWLDFENATKAFLGQKIRDSRPPEVIEQDYQRIYEEIVDPLDRLIALNVNPEDVTGLFRGQLTSQDRTWLMDRILNPQPDATHYGTNNALRGKEYHQQAAALKKRFTLYAEMGDSEAAELAQHLFGTAWNREMLVRYGRPINPDSPAPAAPRPDAVVARVEDLRRRADGIIDPDEKQRLNELVAAYRQRQQEPPQNPPEPLPSVRHRRRPEEPEPERRIGVRTQEAINNLTFKALQNGELAAVVSPEEQNTLNDLRTRLYEMSADLRRLPWYAKGRKDLNKRFDRLLGIYQELWGEKINQIATRKSRQELNQTLKDVSEAVANEDRENAHIMLIARGGRKAEMMKRYAEMPWKKKAAIAIGFGALTFSGGVVPAAVLAGVFGITGLAAAGGALAGSAVAARAFKAHSSVVANMYASPKGKLTFPEKGEELDGLMPEFAKAYAKNMVGEALTGLNREAYKKRKVAALVGASAIFLGTGGGTALGTALGSWLHDLAADHVPRGGQDVRPSIRQLPEDIGPEPLSADELGEGAAAGNPDGASGSADAAPPEGITSDENPEPAPPAPEPVVVEPGDTLSGIAAEQLGPGATQAQINELVGQIAQANNIENPDLIYPGQELVMPGESGAAAPSGLEAPAPGRIAVPDNLSLSSQAFDIPNGGGVQQMVEGLGIAHGDAGRTVDLISNDLLNHPNPAVRDAFYADPVSGAIRISQSGPLPMEARQAVIDAINTKVKYGLAA